MTERVGWRVVAGYALLAYAISWACWLPLVVTGRVVRVGGGATHLPGLLGPALAAVVVGVLLWRRGAPVGLSRRLTHWRVGARWWLVAVSPLAMLAVGVLVAAVLDTPPRAADFALINGFPDWGLGGVLLLLVLVNGFGEETGDRRGDRADRGGGDHHRDHPSGADRGGGDCHPWCGAGPDPGGARRRVFMDGTGFQQRPVM